MTDRDGNVTTVERDALGQPTAIVAPFGQRTALTLDGNGYLASITNPANDRFRSPTPVAVYSRRSPIPEAMFRSTSMTLSGFSTGRRIRPMASRPCHARASPMVMWSR